MAGIGVDAVRGIFGLASPALTGAGGPAKRTGEAAGSGDGAGGFREIFLQAIRDANAAQLEADRLNEQMVTGQVEDVSQVVLAAQKAELSLQLAIQMRNKLLEAYQEIMRMQI